MREAQVFSGANEYGKLVIFICEENKENVIDLLHHKIKRGDMLCHKFLYV
jgi:hypothetical protein